MQEFHLINGGYDGILFLNIDSLVEKRRVFFPNLEEKRRGVMSCPPLLQLRLGQARDEIDGDAGIHTWRIFVPAVTRWKWMEMGHSRSDAYIYSIGWMEAT